MLRSKNIGRFTDVLSISQIKNIGLTKRICRPHNHPATNHSICQIKNMKTVKKEIKSEKEIRSPVLFFEKLTWKKKTTTVLKSKSYYCGVEKVKSNVQAYLPATKITSIAVGNEVLTFNDTSLSGCLLPAMQSVHKALVTLKLDSQVTVTTAHSVAILQTSYPPSAGAFRQDLKGCISPILDFLPKTCFPFLINAYPFFAYKASPKQVSLDFVLFQPNAGVLDPANGLHYDNMLFAQIDAVYAALGRLGYKKTPVQISETGWPSKGDEDEIGVSPENAKKYNANLLKMIGEKRGTPAKPNVDLNIFVI